MATLAADEPCPLPDDPVLADVASALNEAGAWGFVVDDRWRMVYMTDDIRLSNGGLSERVPVPLGAFWFGEETIDTMLQWSGRVFAVEAWRTSLGHVGPMLLEDLGGDAAAIRATIDPRLEDAFDPVPAAAPHSISYRVPSVFAITGNDVDIVVTALRVFRRDGSLAGNAFIAKPAVGMAAIGSLTTGGDLRHFERVLRLARAGRRPAAILFADLEASSALSRSLSTAGYFALGRRFVRSADRAVVDAGGLVGRHAGDGVAAFFLAEDAGSESAAAAGCITAMRALREAIRGVAARSGLEPGTVVLRFGLHWGATLHIGQFTSIARAEVNALGDEVNEAARVEACASGGRALATKALVERLDSDDARNVGIDPDRLTYVGLADLPTATEKARRDAPNLAVCEL